MANLANCLLYARRRSTGMAAVDCYMHHRLISGFVGRNESLFSRRRLQCKRTLYQCNLRTVYRHIQQICVINRHAHGTAVDHSLRNAGDHRRGGIKHNTVRTKEGHIPRRVGNPRVNNNLTVGLQTDCAFISGKRLRGKLFRRQILVRQQILNPQLGIAVVPAADRNGLRIREEQAEADRIQEALPCSALVNAKLARWSRAVDPISFHNGRRDYTRCLIFHIEGQAAVIVFLKNTQLGEPCAVGRIGLRKQPALRRSDDKVLAQPIVGIDAVLAAVGKVSGNACRDPVGLHQTVIRQQRTVAEQCKVRKADRNIAADSDVCKGRHAVEKLKRIAVGHADKLRITIQLGGISAVIQLILDLQVCDRQFSDANVRCGIGRLRQQLVVIRVPARKREVRKGNNFSDTGIFVGIGGRATPDSHVIAVNQAVNRTDRHNRCIRFTVIDLRAFHRRADDPNLSAADHKVLRELPCVIIVILRQGDAQSIASRAGRYDSRVGAVVSAEALVFHQRAGRKVISEEAVERFAVISRVGADVLHLALTPCYSQSDGSHDRRLATVKLLAHRGVSHTNGIHSRCDRIQERTAQRDCSACGHGIIRGIDQSAVKVQRRNGVAVELYVKQKIVCGESGKADGLRQSLRVGIDHDALGVDHANVAACIGHTNVDIRLSVRLNGEFRLAVFKRQLRPIARNGVNIGKGCLRQKVLDHLQTAACIARGNSHGHRLLEEQAEGNTIQEGVEAVRLKLDLRFGRGNIRNALNGDNLIAVINMRHRVGQDIALLRERIERHTVRLHDEAFRHGVAVCNRYGKGVRRSVVDGLSALCRIALAGRQRDGIDLEHADITAYAVACDVRYHHGMEFVLRRDHIDALAVKIRISGGLAVHQNGVFVGFGHGKILIAPVNALVVQSVDDRQNIIDRLHIAAAAELFVRCGVPHANMGMSDDPDVPRAGVSPVNNFAVVHILKSPVICKAIDKMSRGSNPFEGTVLQHQRAVIFHRHFIGERAVCIDLHRAAGFHQSRTVFSVVAKEVQHSAAVHGDLADDRAVSHHHAAAGNIQIPVQRAAIDFDIVTSDIQRPGKGTIGKPAVASIGIYLPLKGDVGRTQQGKVILGNGDRPRDRAAASNIQHAGLGDVDRTDGMPVHIEIEVTGTDGDLVAHIGQQPKLTVPVLFGLRGCQCFRKGYISRRLITVRDNRCKIASALRALVFLVVTGVIAHRYGNSKGP